MIYYSCKIIKHYRVWIQIVFAIVLIMLFYDSLQLRNYRDNGPLSIRYRKALRIANALLYYSYDHQGAIPEKLSDLIPNYVNYTNLDCFFSSHDNSIITLVKTSSLERISSEIVNNGMFIYLGSNGMEADLIIYDRTNLWPKATNVTEIVTLRADCFTPRLRTVSDVQNRLKSIK